jgi:O-antigen biosynthesis protein WbqP
MLDINNLDESKSGRKNNRKISDIGWSRSQRFYVFIVKPALDVIFAVIGLVILSPLFMVISVAIKLDSKGPVFFRQERVGRDKKNFYIFKFRTMQVNTPKDTPTHLFKNPDSYITRTGKILRKTSLDEIPQLINILKREISFIGPRPALWNQFDLIEERDRYNVNYIYPGVTGWAQINGRDKLPIKVKAKYDGVYTEKIGFVMDVRCFFLTIFKVFKDDEIVEGGTKGT